MKIMSFGATPLESSSIKKACNLLSVSNNDNERLEISTDAPKDEFIKNKKQEIIKIVKKEPNKAFITSQKEGSKRIVKLNINNKNGTASVVLKQGTDKECKKYFANKETYFKVIDIFDRLCDLLNRDR